MVAHVNLLVRMSISHITVPLLIQLPVNEL